MEFTHKPVLLAECIEALHIRPEGIYVDGTLGRAGHSREIAQRLTTGRLVCIDRDQAAIDAAQERLAPWMDRVRRPGDAGPQQFRPGQRDFGGVGHSRRGRYVI